jgi:hypothetical protein
MRSGAPVAPIRSPSHASPRDHTLHFARRKNRKPKVRNASGRDCKEKFGASEFLNPVSPTGEVCSKIIYHAMTIKTEGQDFMRVRNRRFDTVCPTTVGVGRKQ